MIDRTQEDVKQDTVIAQLASDLAALKLRVTKIEALIKPIAELRDAVERIEGVLGRTHL